MRLLWWRGEPRAVGEALPVAVPRHPAPGQLLRAPGSRFGERVFFCHLGQRHWIADARWLADNGFAWPDDVQDVPSAQIEAFRPARPAPRRWTEADWDKPPSGNGLDMRELLVSGLRGRGYEIGAGTSPMPVPLDCDVRYMDVYDVAGLQAQSYEGQEVADLVVPDVIASFDDLSAVPDASADFFVACHVIEHTRNPMRSIAEAWRILRPGGQIALVVPEMTRTFDRDRELTKLSHLIEDLHDPSRQRDALHFQEFYSKAFVTPPGAFEQLWRQKWEQEYPIHYHTWTHDSFAAMIRFLSESVCRFDRVWSHPVLDDPQSNECYFVMRKPLC